MRCLWLQGGVGPAWTPAIDAGRGHNGPKETQAADKLPEPLMGA